MVVTTDETIGLTPEQMSAIDAFVGAQGAS